MMARATPIAIPKTVSRLADPTALSFLVLPAELRNKVYGYLLHQDDPVVLHDVWRYREEIGKAQTNCKHLSDGQQQELARPSKVCFEGETYKHGFQGSTAILQTCRQVYHEAASVLYGSNEFSFPMKFMPQVCTHDMLLHFAAKWLLGIGTERALLFKVIVYIRSFKERCNFCGSRGKLDILPVLKAIWADSFVNNKIEIIVKDWPSTSANQNQCQSDSGPISTTLRNLLITLGNDDALELKRYMISRRLMSGVNITMAKVNRVYPVLRPIVIFGEQTSSRPEDSNVRQFDILDHGNEIRWTTRDAAASTLLDLPRKVQNTIWQYVMASDVDVMLDLESETTLGPDFVIDQLFMTTRRYIDDPVIEPPRIIIRMRVERGVITDKSGDTLDSWTDKYDFRYVHFRDDIPHLDFLHLDVQHDRMHEVFMEINEVGYTMHEIARTDAVNCRASSRSTIYSGEGVLWWVHKIQQAEYILFSDIPIHMPEKVSEPVPTMLVNGNFDTVIVVYPATPFSAEQIVECAFANYEVEHFRRLGMEKVQWLTHQMRTD